MIQSSPLATEHSQLAQVFSAAFHTFTEDPAAYSDIYQRYLGVPRSPAPLRDGDGPAWVQAAAVQPFSPLWRALSRGSLRFGQSSHRPYHYEYGNGVFVGFELELGNALTAIVSQHYGVPLRAEWTELDFTFLADPTDNERLYDALVQGLCADDFDIGWSGVIVSQMDDRVVVPCPTLEFFTGLVYTGLDALGPIELEEDAELRAASLVAWLARHPGVSLSGIDVDGDRIGPSYAAARVLAEAVNALVDESGASADPQLVAESVLIDAVDEILSVPTRHFLAADAIVLAAEATAKGPPLENLNVDIGSLAGEAARKEYMAPFCLPDRAV